MIHQPFGQIGVIGRALAADADVFAHLVGGRDGHGQQHLDGRIAFVEQVGDEAGVTVEAPRKPSIEFSSSGSYKSPPSSLKYSLDLKSERRTMTGFGQKAAAMVDTPSTSFSTKNSFGEA